MISAPVKLSKEEREAQKEADRLAKEAVKARKASIKSLKAQYKEYGRLLKSKDLTELNSGIANCNNTEFMSIGGGLASLVKASKAKVWLRVQPPLPAHL